MKVSIVCFLALFAFQGFVDARVYPLEASTKCSSDDTVQTVIARIGELITQFGESEVEAVNALIKTLSQTVELFIQNLQDQSMEVLNKVQKEAECLGEKAEEVVQQGVACTKEQIPNVREAVTTFVDNSKQCFGTTSVGFQKLLTSVRKCTDSVAQLIKCQNKICVIEGSKALIACTDAFKAAKAFIASATTEWTANIACVDEAALKPFINKVVDISNEIIACTLKN